MIYDFKCKSCGKTKEVSCSPSEIYYPDCPDCNKKMIRVFSVPNLSSDATPTKGK